MNGKHETLDEKREQLQRQAVEHRRVSALELALAGSGSDLSADEIVLRAERFERYLREGTSR